jgi:hypothetical protein
MKMIASTGGGVSIASPIEMTMRHGMPPLQLALDHGIRPSLRKNMWGQIFTYDSAEKRSVHPSRTSGRTEE